jgi:hypothetical protein
MLNQEKILRIAFLAGAVTDALAILPMLVPSLAQLLWGFSDETGSYKFAMGYGATFMLAWTILLVWAYRKPVERKFVAVLTVLVIWGFVLTEIMAVLSGSLAAWRMVPSWFMQAILICLFSWGFHYRRVMKWHGRLA